MFSQAYVYEMITIVMTVKYKIKFDSKPLTLHIRLSRIIIGSSLKLVIALEINPHRDCFGDSFVQFVKTIVFMPVAKWTFLS